MYPLSRPFGAELKVQSVERRVLETFATQKSFICNLHSPLEVFFLYVEIPAISAIGSRITEDGKIHFYIGHL